MSYDKWFGFLVERENKKKHGHIEGTNNKEILYSRLWLIN